MMNRITYLAGPSAGFTRLCLGCSVGAVGATYADGVVGATYADGVVGATYADGVVGATYADGTAMGVGVAIGVGVAVVTGVGAGAIGVGTDAGDVVCFSGDWNPPSSEERSEKHTLRRWRSERLSVHRKKHLVAVLQIGNTRNLSSQLIVDK